MPILKIAELFVCQEKGKEPLVRYSPHEVHIAHSFFFFKSAHKIGFERCSIYQSVVHVWLVLTGNTVVNNLKR